MYACSAPKCDLVVDGDVDLNRSITTVEVEMTTVDNWKVVTT